MSNRDANDTSATAIGFGDIRAEWIAAGLIDPNASKTEPKPFDEAEALRAQRLERFQDLCPVEFRQKIDRSKLPNLAAWDSADAWNMQAPGLWLWSTETGRGKSRMAWRLFGRAHVQHGRHVLKTSGQSLAESYFEDHMDGDPRRFYRRALAPDILIIDDIDKAEVSERNRRALRELWDELYSHRKAVIVTANRPIEWFAKDFGPSAVRRMREICTEIKF
jgi:chromosomal replication initiation ATPase DnaA